MGILQAAYRTYENQAHNAGIACEGKEPLTPVSHAIQNAQVEITIDADGAFAGAALIDKKDAKTIIPVTIQSINRTSNSEAHPLCDQISYIAPIDESKFSAYVNGLEAWANSPHSHPKVQAVLKYIQGKSIIADLTAVGVIPRNKAGEPDIAKCSKYLVRWRLSTVPDGVKSACWEDVTLFKAFQAFYAAQCAGLPRDICVLTGKEDMVCDMHPKGVVAASFGAKLISANDHTGFSYRGRFTSPEQAFNIGYQASQMAHHALRWVGANTGVIMGGRTFLCWNPGGFTVPKIGALMPGWETPDINPTAESGSFANYRRELLETLGGFRNALPETEEVVIACMDAATTGRLSVTYYNELKASDFFDRVEYWYESFCWDSPYGLQSPSLQKIANCAFGSQKGSFIEADDRIQKEYTQCLLSCIVDRKPLPAEIVRALVAKCGNPRAYSLQNREGQKNWESLLSTACAALRKDYYDREKKEVWTLKLDKSCTDRSYVFGRLLAVAENIERSTYDREEKREPNAIRIWSMYTQRPMYAWGILQERLVPYLSKLSPPLRMYYRDMIDEIAELLPGIDDPELGKKLGKEYLIGYNHQRHYMRTKKTGSDKEENENESVES